jgi:DNA recombination-dependent growth factor C
MEERTSPIGTDNTTFSDCNHASKASTTTSGDYSIANENFVTIGNKTVPKLNWKRIDYKGDHHDNRRLLVHRAKNCECEVCFRELKKLPPADPVRDKIIARKHKLEEREIRKAKRVAKTQVKEGKQASIRNFFRY